MTTKRALYTTDDLESLTDVNRHTIRHWSKIGLLQPAYTSGGDLPRWGEEHLNRIKKILMWKERKCTDSEMAERIRYIGDKALDVSDVYDYE